MDIIIESKRLLLRPLVLSDVDDFFLMNGNPNVNKYLRTPLKTKADTEQYIRKIINEYQKNGIGRFAAVLKENNKLIGFSGLKYRNRPENNHIDFYDIGYRFSEGYWRKGFASEAALAWVDYGFNIMKLTEIHACAVSNNEASNNLLKKIGFGFVNEYTANGSLHNWYTIKNKIQ